MSESMDASVAKDDSNSGAVDTDDTSVDVEVSHAHLRKKKKCTSLVWLKFEKYTDVDGVEWATCNACKTKLTGSSKSGTTHLWKHLDSCVENKRVKCKDGGESGTEPFKFDQALSRGDLTRMVIMHEYPFAIVQYHGFQVFVKNLQPQFKMVLATENDDFDVLGWWKENGTKYPILSLIARDILGVPVSIVASEAAFSTGGRVVSHTRSSLHPSTVEGLICTQDWLRNELKGQGIDKVEDVLATIFSPEVEEDNITIAEDDDLDDDDDDDDDDDISLSHI